MKKLSFLCYKLFIAIVILSSCSKEIRDQAQTLYVIHNSEFGIHADKTNAIETTEGINKAIEHAKAEGYKAVKLTEGDCIHVYENHMKTLPL